MYEKEETRMTPESSSPLSAVAPLAYAVGIDIGMEACTMCCLTMDKRQVIKPSSFDNTAQGCSWLLTRLEQLKSQPQQILIGLEATSRYGENLYHALLKGGYRVCLLHPGQVHAFSQQRGLRAKTDRLDCNTIARVLLSGEARFGYVPSEQIITYRELVRLQLQLAEEGVRYKNEIHALLVVLFPEFSQVFADPSKPTALAVLKAYPSAQAMGETRPEDVYCLLHELCPRHYGRKTAAKLVQLAQMSVSSAQAVAARSSCLRILCDQLQHTQRNLSLLEEEIDRLLDQDPKSQGVLSIPELGPMTVAGMPSRIRGPGSLYTHGSGGGLCGHGFAGETKWQMERTDEVVQARQWSSSSHPVPGRFAEYSPAHLSLWDLLPSSRGSWHEKRYGGHSSYAQVADRRCPSHPNAGGL